MYTITRQEAAKILDISTRSVDRYAKAGKIRSIKDGKTVFLHKNDVYNFYKENSDRQEIIIPSKNKSETKSFESSKEVKTLTSLDRIYVDLRNEINKKDSLIQDLSIKLGAAEEIAKNSISMIDYNKSKNLLEESKDSLGKEINELRLEKYNLKKDLKYEKKTTSILLVVVTVLIVICVFIWYSSIK